ncbi:prolyl hydroxylase family protein [Chitinibacteraceae bacterium HSL-7]
MQIETFGAGVFVIRDFLTPDECIQHIQASEGMGYAEAMITTAAGPELHKDVRNNDRIIYDDHDLAARLFERAKPHLPPRMENRSVSGLNERFRFYRYQDQQYFKFHVDGSFRRNENEASCLSFLIYLNDGFSGGETDFIWDRVRPQTGSALVFPHRLKHQGMAVTSGIKYVLRTDVMYSIPRFYNTDL